MRWLTLALIPALMAFAPLVSTHDSTDKVDQEIRNIEQNLQGVEFAVVTDTPALTEMRDGQILLLSSGTVNKLIWRVNQEIYAVSGTSITIRR